MTSTVDDDDEDDNCCGGDDNEGGHLWLTAEGAKLLRHGGY